MKQNVNADVRKDRPISQLSRDPKRPSNYSADFLQRSWYPKKAYVLKFRVCLQLFFPLLLFHFRVNLVCYRTRPSTAVDPTAGCGFMHIVIQSHTPQGDGISCNINRIYGDKRGNPSSIRGSNSIWWQLSLTYKLHVRYSPFSDLHTFASNVIVGIISIVIRIHIDPRLELYV